MRKVLAVLALTTIALTGCSTAPMARISQNFQPAHSADFTTATHKALTAPVAQPVAPEPVATPAQPVAQPVAPVAQPVAPVQVAQPTAVAPAPRCEEDQPCFDCHTMGNLQCGPVASVVAPTAPVAQPVAINPVDQGGYASAGKDAPVGPAPEGITTSPINLGDLDTTAPCAYKRCGDPATTKAHVDGACQQSINDLQLQLDAANSGERITGHSGTGSQCTISTTK